MQLSAIYSWPARGAVLRRLDEDRSRKAVWVRPSRESESTGSIGYIRYGDEVHRIASHHATFRVDTDADAGGP
jgi:hypothetical protein